MCMYLYARGHVRVCEWDISFPIACIIYTSN